MKIFISFIFIFLLGFPAFGSQRVVDALNNDRVTRLEEINRLVLKINQAERELENFRFELQRVESDNSKLNHHIFMRNTAGVIAALGFATTLMYHKKYVTPGAFILVGGYTLSAVSAIVVAIEDKGVRLSRKEIHNLKQSIVKLETLIRLEKRNLEKEISILGASFY